MARRSYRRILTDRINRRHGVDVKAVEAVKQGHRLGVGTPVVGELLAGLENSSSRDRHVARFERLWSRLTIWPYDELAARKYAKIASNLRRRGVAIQQIHMQTAALAVCLCEKIGDRPNSPSTSTSVSSSRARDFMPQERAEEDRL